MYRILTESLADRQIKKLDDQWLRRVDRAICSLMIDPSPKGSAKIKSQKGDVYRVRVGIYRIIYLIDDFEGTVRIRIVEQRSKAYKDKK